jgi:hypothetical protein
MTMSEPYLSLPVAEFERLCGVERVLNAENDRLLAQLADLRAVVRDHIAAGHDHLGVFGACLGTPVLSGPVGGSLDATRVSAPSR